MQASPDRAYGARVLSMHIQVLLPSSKRYYGGCSLGTQSSKDQLWRADDGSWQIADGSDLRTAPRHVPRSLPSAIAEFTSSPSCTCSWSLNRAVRETGANMVSRTKERAIDPLLVPALLALATPSIC